MNRYLCLFITILNVILLGLPFTLSAQIYNVDSLKRAVKNSKNGAGRIETLTRIADYYDRINSDSCVYYSNLVIAESRKANDIRAEAYATGDIADVFFTKGNYVQAANLDIKILRIFEQLKDSAKIANTYLGMGQLNLNDAPASHKYFTKCRLISTKIKDYFDLYWSCNSLSVYFLKFEQPDSALFYALQALNIQQQQRQLKVSRPRALLALASVYTMMNKQELSAKVVREALHLAIAIKDPYLNLAQFSYAKQLLQVHMPDSALIYATKVLNHLSENPDLNTANQLYNLLADIYRQKKQYELAFQYQSMGIKTNDSLYNSSQIQQTSNLMFNEKQRQTDLKNAAAAYQSKMRFYGAIAVLIIAAIIVAILLISYKKQQKANRLLKEQKTLVEEQRDHTNKALSELKATQTQLIQSEKMASLGELTAGIAHEIQNPLNFVNNFSEVNQEMIDELEEELKAGNIDEALAIAADIKQNEQKINHHGKRADGIVKGMLQHSRSSSGEKQPTDLNTLADEFMRLSYHGLRAKDKSFNAEMITHFDEALPKANVIPQDIGRVLLNLFNNAFYAVNQKQKRAGADYKPEVSLTTSTGNEEVIIKVKDNGVGIPDAIKDKIMQPFFTTKPTGEGTGLGLSLTYDMVVKGYGGTISVDTKAGGFTEFTVSLPV